MKTPSASSKKRAFTLLELLVAMTVTTLIVASLISITSIAMDTWNRSRSELRAARQAKSMVDTMARDFEALVTRRGNDQSEWLSAKAETDSKSSSSAASLIFFTAATDRYDGEIGTAKDLGGDVSCVGYQLDWRDPIQGGAQGSFQTFVLNRHLVDPKATFDTLLGKPDLASVFMAAHGSGLDNQKSFVCENVFQFAVTFNIQVTTTTGATSQIENKMATIGPSGTTQSLRIKGTGIETSPVDSTLASGRITSVGISLSVLSDAGVEQLRKNGALADNAAWLAKNSYQYSKLVQLPGM